MVFKTDLPFAIQSRKIMLSKFEVLFILMLCIMFSVTPVSSWIEGKDFPPQTTLVAVVVMGSLVGLILLFAKLKNTSNGKDLARVDDILDARDALSTLSINKTALDLIARAFCDIRACSHDDPYRVSQIADALHNIPGMLQSGDHQALRDEVVRAILTLNNSNERQ